VKFSVLQNPEITGEKREGSLNFAWRCADGHRSA
jgi:hypothetical protein